MDTQKITQLLQQHNIKPSHHRIRVFDYLVENRNHPSVDMIHSELVKEIPTLSKTTLYNILNLFVEKGIVSLITIDENETHYDADTSMHGHFKCSRCQNIYDIRIKLSNPNFTELNNFEVNEIQIYFKGICPQCSNKNR